MEDWYSVNARALIDIGGVELLKRHNMSIQSLLMYVFSDFPWDFNRTAVTTETGREFHKQFFDQLAIEFNIVDWA